MTTRFLNGEPGRRPSSAIRSFGPLLAAASCLAGGPWNLGGATGPIARGEPASVEATAEETVNGPADWTIPSEETIAGWIEQWIGRSGLDAATAGRVLAAWRGVDPPPANDPPATGADASPTGTIIDRVVAAIAESDERVAALLPAAADARRSTPSTTPWADLAWLDDPGIDPFVREAVRLHAARLLVERGLFEEALRFLDSTAEGRDPGMTDLSRSVDPARQLFLQAACLHWLLDSARATDALERLLQRADEIPVRYERMARLMLDDLAGLEDDSLDHIARRMRDVTRRLSFGRAGSGTRKVQDGVIESLDKLIAKLEQQQQEQNAQGGGAGSGAGGGSGSKPMQDSMPAGGTGPGEVTKRDLGEPADWGNLPPREREAALQQIGREFPPHYREAIEQYFKRLASGNERSTSPDRSAPPPAARPTPRP